MPVDRGVDEDLSRRLDARRQALDQPPGKIYLDDLLRRREAETGLLITAPADEDAISARKPRTRVSSRSLHQIEPAEHATDARDPRAQRLHSFALIIRILHGSFPVSLSRRPHGSKFPAEVSRRNGGAATYSLPFSCRNSVGVIPVLRRKNRQK